MLTNGNGGFWQALSLAEDHKDNLKWQKLASKFAARRNKVWALAGILGEFQNDESAHSVKLITQEFGRDIWLAIQDKPIYLYPMPPFEFPDCLAEWKKEHVVAAICRSKSRQIEILHKKKDLAIEERNRRLKAGTAYAKAKSVDKPSWSMIARA